MNFELINPQSFKELFLVLKKLKHRKYRYAAGCTDILIELKRNPEDDLTLVNLSQIKDFKFRGISQTKNSVRLGAGVTANDIVRNLNIKLLYPVLWEAAYNLASTQIRQVATIGGNICTASPSGDITCALVSLDATCVIIGVHGEREIRIRDFFEGPRQTALKKGELLYEIIIPGNKKNTVKLFSSFIKIGTRRSMECSVVSIAYHIQIDGFNKILTSGFAIGAVAPTIRFTAKACNFINRKNINALTERDAESFALKVSEYSDPISDIRATRWYREKVLFNLSKSIIEDIIKCQIEVK
ncbi:MAG: FAD binding domain-containing protein [Ignavibacteriaceae bacterium]|nr:FAD binding domain-containing protein [Ignavibacteriaceae bacterium]